MHILLHILLQIDLPLVDTLDPFDTQPPAYPMIFLLLENQPLKVHILELEIVSNLLLNSLCKLTALLQRPAHQVNVNLFEVVVGGVDFGSFVVYLVDVFTVN
jgi:hypothetical protein